MLYIFYQNEIYALALSPPMLFVRGKDDLCQLIVNITPSLPLNGKKWYLFRYDGIVVLWYCGYLMQAHC